MSKRLLLLGAGQAHAHVLQALAQQPLVGAEVALVTPHARQIHPGMVPGLVAGHYRAEQCAVALQPLAAAAQVHFIEGSAVSLDTTARRVTLADGRVAEYDVLSLDTAALMDRQRWPGAREQGLFLRPIEHFVHLLDGLLDLASRRVLDVVVVGGGASGVELAMALQHRLAGRGEERARVALVTGGGEPLADHPPDMVQRAARALARRRITVFRDNVAALQPGAVVLASGARLACDAPVLATDVEAPGWLVGSGLTLDEAGFVCTGPMLQSVSHPEVFAAGDVAGRSDAPHARREVYASRAGAALALNLRRFIGGGALTPLASQQRALHLLACGEKQAIVSWGGLTAQGRWAWWWKDRIDRAWVQRCSRPAEVTAALTRSA
jgi:pyridine nucleotide-disulfide oxidoreductase family protein